MYINGIVTTIFSKFLIKGFNVNKKLWHMGIISFMIGKGRDLSVVYL